MSVTDRNGHQLEVGSYAYVHYSDESHSEVVIVALDPGTDDGHEVGVSYDGNGETDNWHLPSSIEFVDDGDTGPHWPARP